MNDRLAADLAGAILDGRPIDWAAAEAEADEANRPLLDQFRALATLADVHRRDPETAATASSPTPQEHAAAFERWGHLRIVEPIGFGAFGEVYRAWDERLDREVALKLMPAERATAGRAECAVIEEGRLLARVRHPHVVTIFGADKIAGRVGLWMEFVQGSTLKQIVDAGRVFTVEEVRDLGVALCGAVAAVHAAGLLHRDIKAQNVMLSADGRIVLMDFGTGRELADTSASDLAGTPLYLAPEVLDGHEATVRSDVYSLGVLLFLLATGSYPVQAPTLHDIHRAHQENARAGERPPGRRTALSPKLARIVERAIDPRPERRYQSAGALAADLSALERPPAPASRTRALIVGAGLLASIGLVWEVAGRQARSAYTPSTLIADRLGWDTASTRNISVTDGPVIVVLPLENLSREPGSDDFVDGLTDEIIRNLAVVRGLHVRSRTSSFAFKGRPRPLRDVAGQLGATLIVEGSVLRSGNRLRVNAQLIRVEGEVPLWSGRFDRELNDVFAIQDEISRAIVDSLRLTLNRGQRHYDIDPETYELFLRGRALVARGAVPGIEQAVSLFEQVLAKDPAFAPAHAGLASAYAWISESINSTFPFERAQSILRSAALKARELDPQLADAHAALGWAYSREHDWANAEQAFQRAIELNPSLTETYTSYSISTLQPLGKLDEALRILDVARRNDPLSLSVLRGIGDAQLLAGQYEEAIGTFQHVASVEPDFPFVKSLLGRALTFAGRQTEAISLLEGLDGRHLGFERTAGLRPPWLARPYVMTGQRAKAEALLAEHEKAPSSLASIHAALGDKDRTFEALEKLAVGHPHHIPRMLALPELALLRGDPRLTSWRERFRLPPR